MTNAYGRDGYAALIGVDPRQGTMTIRRLLGDKREVTIVAALTPESAATISQSLGDMTGTSLILDLVKQRDCREDCSVQFTEEEIRNAVKVHKRIANEEKVQFIFDQVFTELNLEWIGPEFDFDRDSYKARVQRGNLKGKLVYVSEQKLEDKNVSAEHVKQELLIQLRRELARLHGRDGTGS